MRRFLTSVFFVALVVAFSAPVFADSMSGMPGMTMSPRAKLCPSGKKWVKAYKKKSGTWVKGYCRPMAMATPKPAMMMKKGFDAK